MGYREQITDILSCKYKSEHFISIHNFCQDKNYISNKIEKKLDYLLQRVENNLPIYFTVQHEIIDSKKCFDDIIYNIEKYNLTTVLISQKQYPLTNIQHIHLQIFGCGRFTYKKKYIMELYR